MAMREKIAFLSLILLFLFSQCSHSPVANQIKLGVWAAQHDLWEEAIFRWKKALQTNPDSAAVHNNLAVAYEKKKLWEEAQREYELALKLDPKNEYVKSNYQRFQENKQAIEKEKKANEKK